jgi:hypothetical protein
VQELATRLAQTADELAAFVQMLTPDEWCQRGQNSPIWSLGADEVRPVGMIAYHAASVIGIHTGMLREALAGRPMLGDGRWEVDGVATWNAAVAQDKAGVSPSEVLSDLRNNTAAALELLRSFDNTYWTHRPRMETARPSGRSIRRCRRSGNSWMRR